MEVLALIIQCVYEISFLGKQSQCYFRIYEIGHDEALVVTLYYAVIYPLYCVVASKAPYLGLCTCSGGIWGTVRM